MNLWILSSVVAVVFVVQFLIYYSKKLNKEAKTSLMIEFISIFLGVTVGVFLGIYFSNYNQKIQDEQNLTRVWEKSTFEVQNIGEVLKATYAKYQLVKNDNPEETYQHYIKENLIIDLSFNNQLLNDISLMKETHLQTFVGMKVVKSNVEKLYSSIDRWEMTDQKMTEYLQLLKNEVEKLRKITFWEMNRINGKLDENTFQEFHEKLKNERGQ